MNYYSILLLLFSYALNSGVAHAQDTVRDGGNGVPAQVTSVATALKTALKVLSTSLKKAERKALPPVGTLLATLQVGLDQATVLNTVCSDTSTVSPTVYFDESTRLGVRGQVVRVCFERWTQVTKPANTAKIYQLLTEVLTAFLNAGGALSADSQNQAEQWIEAIRVYNLSLQQIAGLNPATQNGEKAAFWIKGKKDYHGFRWWIVGASLAVPVPILLPLIGPVVAAPLAIVVASGIFGIVTKQVLEEIPSLGQARRWSPEKIQKEKARLLEKCHAFLQSHFASGTWNSDQTEVTFQGKTYHCGEAFGEVSSRRTSTVFSIPVLEKKL